jgi:predicted O-linked N-acetylglucosamine transferase (SPINDLY family)
MTTDQLLELATSRHRTGDLIEARRLYRQLLAGVPTHVTALFRGGLLELQDGRPEQALGLMQQAATIAPGEPRHHVGLGQTLQALGRFADAAAAYRRVLRAEPCSADAHFAIGIALQSQAEYLEAIDAYEQAVRLQADHFAALNNLGNCQQRCGRIAQAVTAYTRALALKPGEAGTMANLGTALQGVGRLDEAVELLRAAVDLEPRVTPHAVNLGIALCRRRDFSAAATALPALERGYLTLGCLNNPCKLTDETLRLWGRVMQAISDSRLLLLAPPGRHGLRLSQRLAAHGIAAERVDFVPYRTRASYLRSYHDIDLGLDTVPYNGHTTSLDSLWMGVPTITRVGQTCVGRGGLSQLFQLGLRDLAAATDEAFIGAAVALSQDIARLAKLRQQLRARLEQSPLMDAPRFARHLEAAYRGMWSVHCGTKSAGSGAIMH